MRRNLRGGCGGAEEDALVEIGELLAETGGAGIGVGGVVEEGECGVEVGAAFDDAGVVEEGGAAGDEGVGLFVGVELDGGRGRGGGCGAATDGGVASSPRAGCAPPSVAEGSVVPGVGFGVSCTVG